MDFNKQTVYLHIVLTRQAKLLSLAIMGLGNNVKKIDGKCIFGKPPLQKLHGEYYEDRM